MRKTERERERKVQVKGFVPARIKSFLLHRGSEFLLLERDLAERITCS